MLPDFLKILFVKGCSECNQNHDRTDFCSECRGCLWKHGILNDSEYPLYKCAKCQYVNFWRRDISFGGDMLTWEIKDEVHHCYSNGVHSASVTLKDGRWHCDFYWEPLDQRGEENFDHLEHAKHWVEHFPHQKICTECNEFHECISFCEKCNACLYNHCKWLNDPDYPLARCTKCNHVNWWD